MKLYFTSGVAVESNGGRQVLWSGTQADSAKDRKTIRGSGAKDVETVEVAVPTDKGGLLAFLNKHKADAS